MKNLLLVLLTCLFTYTANAQCTAGFTYSGSGLTLTFTNTSTPTIAPSPGFNYTLINFGGSTNHMFTGSTMNHTFPSAGTYMVITTIYVYDSTTFAYCSDKDSQWVNVTNGPCAVSISSVKNGTTVVFTANNLSSTPGMTYSWNFGDGNTGTGSPVTHTYASAGNYGVTLTGSSTTASCSQTDSTNINVIIPPNKITGGIVADSNVMDTFKVWLITYDSSTQILAAIDSVIVSNGFTQVPVYTFNNVPAGQYRTKAAKLNGPSTGTGFIPTYHISSLYWNTATIINHTGGTSSGKDIYMQSGTITAGPGFIGGNVTMGANKGTAVGDPVEGMQIILRDNANNAVKFTYTDANGNYSFNNIPTGIYSIYPEEGGYTTTSASVLLNPSDVTKNAVSFEKSESKKTVSPKATGINDISAANLFSVSPNPSHGTVYINWSANTKGNADVTVTDISGRTVHQSVVNTNAKTTLNLHQLQPGLYFINIQAGNQSASKQIVIQK